MLSFRSASIKFKTQSKSRSNWKERPSDLPQRTETDSDQGTSDCGPLNAQFAPRGVDLKYWPVKFGDPDEKAHPVVNALSNACMQAARMQNPGRRLDMDEGRRRAWRRSNKYLCAPSKSIIRTIQTSSNNYFFKRRD